MYSIMTSRPIPDKAVSRTVSSGTRKAGGDGRRKKGRTDHRMMRTHEETMVGICLAIQHRLNPLHLYCRFMDRGLGRRLSFSLCRAYELILFFWINWLLKSVIYICCFLNGNDKVRGRGKETPNHQGKENGHHGP